MSRNRVLVVLAISTIPAIILVVLAITLLLPRDEGIAIPHLAASPPAGAAEGARARGAVVFHDQCQRCHVPYLGIQRRAQAPRLEGYLSESWLYRLLSNPDDVAFFGATKARGGMEGYSRLGEAQLASLSGFVASLRNHDGPADSLPDSLRAGRDLFHGAGCELCHSLEPGEPRSAPSLGGYGSDRWLRGLLRDPAAPAYYGHVNGMPSFENKLSEDQLSDVIAYVESQSKER